MSEVTAIGMIFAGLVGWLAGYMVGMNTGIKDTEQRWSDAVGRADAARASRESRVVVVPTAKVSASTADDARPDDSSPLKGGDRV